MEPIILAAVSGAAIAIYYFIDPNRDMERHYHRHDKKCYYLLQIACAVLFLAFAFNARFVVVRILKFIYRAGILRLRRQ